MKSFVGMGYEVGKEQEVEYDLYNFEKLNIPEDHPAKNEQIHFTLIRKLCTSYPDISGTGTCDGRGNFPIRMIAPGRVFVPDEVDATHSPSAPPDRRTCH